MRYANTTSDSANAYRFSEKKHIRRQTAALASERIAFLDVESLGDIDVYGEDGDTRRKVRRIVEKRVCQSLYRQSRAGVCDNYGRYNEKHRVSNHLKNLYGGFPSSYDYAA